MKSNELMIGDKIRQKNSGIFLQISSVQPPYIIAIGEEGRFHEDTIEPIQLTKEILEKNGMKPFEIDKLTDKATAKWWHKSGDFFIKQYHFKHNGFNPSYSFGCHNHTLIEGIEYVHELQHALRLCKIEKEIVL